MNELYANRDARLDTLLGRITEASRTRFILESWNRTDRQVDLVDWAREEYGVMLYRQEEGIGIDYTVVDEQKHLLFLLRCP